jgi:hypothetical protein
MTLKTETMKAKSMTRLRSSMKSLVEHKVYSKVARGDAVIDPIAMMIEVPDASRADSTVLRLIVDCELLQYVQKNSRVLGGTVFAGQSNA